MDTRPDRGTLRLPVVLASAAMLVGAAGCESPGGRSLGSWTIRCAESQGPGAYQRMQDVAQLLRRTQGIRPDDVVVRQDADGFARLYYGAYDRTRDRKTGKRVFPPNMRADMDLLRDLGDDSGRRYFARAMPARRPTQDVGNLDWSLRTVRATYTLQVGVFEPTDEFRRYKYAAAEYCRLLREQGHEAYYYHSDVNSLVTVGTFGPEAVVRGSDGRVSYSSEVRALQRTESLQYNTVNGAIHRRRTEDGYLVATPSFLVEIPKTVRPS